MTASADVLDLVQRWAAAEQQNDAGLRAFAVETRRCATRPLACRQTSISGPQGPRRPALRVTAMRADVTGSGTVSGFEEAEVQPGCASASV